MAPRVLVVDNYDSFVYNLVQYLGELGAEPLVHRHDGLSLAEIDALEPDAVLISPGPGRPEHGAPDVEAHGRGVPRVLDVVVGGVVRLPGRERLAETGLAHLGRRSVLGLEAGHLAKRVYAGMRNPVDHPDSRVFTLPLDVTDMAQIKAAAARIDVLDVIINNAGVGTYEELADRATLEHHLAVNLYGPYDLTM